MYTRAIHLNNAVLAYVVQGHGSRALLMFHGAGQDRSVFHKLPSALTDNYRVYAFDLFFHGESQWNNNGPISKNDWKLLINEFCAVEQVGKMSVLGYSMGARFALATLESFPKKVGQCFLVAPDGLISSVWFSIATGSAMGRRIFKSFIDNPRRLHQLFQVGQRVGIMDSATLRFIEHQLDNEQKRLRIYQAWTCFRLLQFDRSALRLIIDEEPVSLSVFLATRDRIIAIGHIRSFLTRLKSAHLEIIDSNHRRVLNEALERIAMN